MAFAGVGAGAGPEGSQSAITAATAVWGAGDEGTAAVLGHAGNPARAVAGPNGVHYIYRQPAMAAKKNSPIPLSEIPAAAQVFLFEQRDFGTVNSSAQLPGTATPVILPRPQQSVLSLCGLGLQ